MNYYSSYSADGTIRLKKVHSDALVQAFADAQEAGTDGNFQVSVGPAKQRGERTAFIFAEQGNPDEISPALAAAIGRAIGQGGLPHLEIGFAFTADRLVPGSQGGGRLRIYPDGRIVEGQTVWPPV